MSRLDMPSVASAEEAGLLLLKKEARFDELPFLEDRTFSESIEGLLKRSKCGSYYWPCSYLSTRVSFPFSELKKTNKSVYKYSNFLITFLNK
ncbi:hypothetical protein Hanom_Chr12g01162391 [Helianthus anomalus]